MKKFTHVAVALILAVVALSGCSRSPKVAAVVDGREITINEVNALAEGVGQDHRKSPDAYRGLVFATLLMREPVDKLIADNKLDLKTVDETAKKNFGPLMDGPRADFYRTWTKGEMVRRSVAPQDLAATYAAMRGKTRINPEFGAMLSPNFLQAVDAGAGPLAQFLPRPQAQGENQ